MQIVGVGFDDTDLLQTWAENEAFDYELWFDTNKTLALFLGAVTDPDTPNPNRLTVLLDGDGEMLLQYDVGFNFGAHPADVLEDCTAIFGG